MVRNARILTLLTGLALTLAAPASALTVLIDFEAFDGTPALGWNLFDASNSSSVVDLFDTTGADSGIDLQLPNLFNNAGAFDAWNDANPLPAWAPDSAADDYVYFTTFNTFFTFSGLDPAFTYDFDLIVSRDLSRSQDHRMITGIGDVEINDWNSQTNGYNAGNTLSWTGLVPTAGGTITLRIHRDGTSAMLNAARVVSVDAPPVSLLLAASALILGVAVAAQQPSVRSQRPVRH
jgi:hypothetical protein